MDAVSEEARMSHLRRPRRTRNVVSLFVLILLLSVRLATLIPVVANPERSLTTDSRGYLDLAESLRTSGTLQSPDQHTEGIRTPGYPLFIAAVQWLAGPGVAPVIVAQVLLSIGVAGLLFLLGVRVGGNSVGWAAAFLWAMNPNSIFWPFLILSEALFAGLLVGCLLLVVLALDRGSWWLMTAAGILLGFAILVRPIGIYLIPLWFAVLLFRGVRRDGWGRAWRAPAVLGIAAYALVFAWSVRNYAVHGEFYYSKVSGSTIRSFILAPALADARGISRSEAAPLIPVTGDPATILAEIFAESPWSIPKVLAAGFLRTALGTEAETWLGLYGLPGASQGLLGSLLRGELTRIVGVVRGIFSSWQTTLYWALVLWGAAYAVTAWGAAIIGWVRKHGRLGWVGGTAHWLAAWTTVYLVAVPLSNGDARFRMPVDPLLAFLAGIAFLGWAGLRQTSASNPDDSHRVSA